MSMPKTYKLAQVQKDFDIKSKDLLTVLAEINIVKKSVSHFPQCICIKIVFAYKFRQSLCYSYSLF